MGKVEGVRSSTVNPPQQGRPAGVRPTGNPAQQGRPSGVGSSTANRPQPSAAPDGNAPVKPSPAAGATAEGGTKVDSASRQFFGPEPTDKTAPAAPASRDEAQVQAARRMIQQGRSFDELPPPLQRAWLANQKSENEAGYKRTVQAHSTQAQDPGPEGVVDQVGYGLKTTGNAAVSGWKSATGQDKVEEAEATERDLHQKKVDRYEQRMAAQDPQRYQAYKQRQQAADKNIAADADPETWRRRDAERQEEEGSRAVLARDRRTWEADLARRNPAQAERYRNQQQRALDSIVDDGAPEALDRGAWRQQIRDDEQRLLARDKSQWLTSLSPAQRAAFEARQQRDNESIMASGMESSRHMDVVKDTLTMGANTASKRDGAGAAALELVTFGSYGLTRAAGQDLGRASAYRDQAAQLRQVGVSTDAHQFQTQADEMTVRGSVELGLAGANMLLMTKGAATVATNALQKAGLMTAAEAEAGTMARVAVTREAGALAEKGGASIVTSTGEHAGAPVVGGRSLHTSEVVVRNEGNAAVRAGEGAVPGTKAAPVLPGEGNGAVHAGGEALPGTKPILIGRGVLDPGGNWTVLMRDGKEVWVRRPNGSRWIETRTADRQYFQTVERARDGGPDWILHQEGGNNSTFRWRDPGDGRGPWKETLHRDGIQGERWVDGELWFKDGANEWTIRTGGGEGLQSEAARQGYRTLEVPGVNGAPWAIKVHGNASKAQLERLGSTLKGLPPNQRELVKDVYLSQNLGRGNTGPIAGLAGRDGGIILDRDALMHPSGRGLVYHEVGHLSDFSTRWVGFKQWRLRPDGIWGLPGKSVSAYAKTNAAEEFAEVYRVFFERPLTRVFGPALKQKCEISRLTGVSVVSDEALAVAGGGTAAAIAAAAWLYEQSRSH